MVTQGDTLDEVTATYTHRSAREPSRQGDRIMTIGKQTLRPEARKRIDDAHAKVDELVARVGPESPIVADLVREWEWLLFAARAQHTAAILPRSS